MTHAGAFYPQPKWALPIAEIGSGLLPTIHAQEPGWVVGGTVEVVDRDGNPPSHWNQRWYDKNTGRLVQKGLTQIVKMWPTPTLQTPRPDFRRWFRAASGGMDLSVAVTMSLLPTDKRNAHAVKNLIASLRTNTGTSASNAKPIPKTTMAMLVGGALNPEWVEWLMGWPIGWTGLEPLATDKFRQWQRSHGIYLWEGNDE